ncbi:hypothetical protein V8E36_003439 [Tilletia maclaganii]
MRQLSPSILILSALVLFLGLLVPSAQAGVYITTPEASTKERGGRNIEIQWRDDHKAPRLKNWGNLTFWLATGSPTTQFMLQRLATDVRPNAHSVKAKLDASVGENSAQYFVRVVGAATLKDDTHPETYSARFQISGMTGKFNSTVQAALKSAGTKGSSTTAAAGGAAGGAAGTKPTSSSSTTAPSSTTSARPSLAAATTSNTGAAQVRAENPLRAASSVAVALGCLAMSVVAGLAMA